MNERLRIPEGDFAYATCTSVPIGVYGHT
jgi:hypothetical protein